jgi:signal peptidase I
VLQGIALAVGLGLLVGGFVLTAMTYRPSFVPTPSMQPTITAGDTVLVQRVKGGSIGRGDIVVFKNPLWGNETLVKRVVGIGGDTVVCCDAQHRLTVNGVPVDEPYLSAGAAPTDLAGVSLKAGQPFSAQVPAGRLFVLGDNRNGSLDSRVHLEQLAGTVATSDVSGRVEATVWPASHLGLQRRTAAFDGLGGPAAGRPGPLVPLAWAMAAGTAVIVLVSLTSPVAALARRVRGRR